MCEPVSTAPKSWPKAEVIFGIGGNNYRLVVRISYRIKQVMVKFVGTHAEYDRINPEIV